jgi:putative flippase GtrA
LSQPDGPPARGPLRQLVRYTGVGGLATLSHYALLVALVELFSWPAPWASGAGAVLGAQVAWAGNRRFTFGHSGSRLGSWWRFQGTALLGAAVGMAIVAAGVVLGVHYLAAQVVATAVGLALTFGVNRAWTFRRD